MPHALQRTAGYLTGGSVIVLAVLVLGIGIVHLAAQVETAVFAVLSGVVLCLLGALATPAGYDRLARRLGGGDTGWQAITVAVALTATAVGLFAAFVAVAL